MILGARQGSQRPVDANSPGVWSPPYLAPSKCFQRGSKSV